MQVNQTKTDNQSTVQKKENTQEVENKLKNPLLSEEGFSNNPFLAEGQTSSNPWINPNQVSTNPFLPKDAKSVNPWINPSQKSVNPFLPKNAKPSVNPFLPVQKKENEGEIQGKDDTKINQTSSNTIQRLVDRKEFTKNYADEGRLSIKSDTLKKIKDLLDEYHALDKEKGAVAIASLLGILEEIKAHTSNWLEDHKGDKSREKRVIGMENFYQHIQGELISIRQTKSIIDDQAKNGQPTLDYEQSDRGDKLKEINAKHEGSAKSVLEKAGILINLAVPNPGDKSKLEMEAKIPVDPSGVGFLGARLMFQAERGKKAQYKIRCEMTITGGAKIGSFAEVKGELGGFFEVQAETAEKTLQLLSYAFYRRFAESRVLPAEMSNFMWGGSTSIAGYRKAEKWAANVEKEVFGGASDPTKTYVDTGVMGGVSGFGGVENIGPGLGGVSAKGGLKISGGTRIDKESIQTAKLIAELDIPKALAAKIAEFLTKHQTEKTKQKATDKAYTEAEAAAQKATGTDKSQELDEALAKATEARDKAVANTQKPLDDVRDLINNDPDLDKDKKKMLLATIAQDKEKAFLGITHEYGGRGDAQRKIGKNMLSGELSGEVTGGPFKGGVKGSLLLVSGANRDEALKFSEFSAEGVLTGSINIGKDIGSGFINGASSVIEGLSNFLRRMAVQNQSKEFDGASYGGIMLGASTQVGLAGQAMAAGAEGLKNPLTKALKPLEEGFKFAASVGMNITLKFKREAGPKHSVELSINNVKTMGIGHNIPGLDVFSLKQETIARIATLKWETGKGWLINPELF